MASDIDQVWQEQQDDVFNVVADIDPPSSRIEYAFKAGCVAVAAEWEEFDYERDNPKRLAEHVLALMVERDKANAEVDRLNRLVDTLSRGLARYQDEEVGPELCRCGRPAVYLNRRVGSEIKPDPTPYCEACEYGPCATCDCVPARP